MFNHKFTNVKKMVIIIKILKQTNIDRVLVSFALFILLAAYILSKIEPSIHSLPEALWYCFVTFTTVGYGDVIAQTVLGRIISVILMLIGIGVVSLLTGVIVNYYNELTRIRNDDVLNSLMSKLENLENLSKEELREISQKITAFRNER